MPSQVHIVDGRVITGNLSCIDKQQNLVLQHATQSYSAINDPTGERQLGTVIVPRKQRKSCHVEVCLTLSGNAQPYVVLCVDTLCGLLHMPRICPSAGDATWTRSN